MVLEMIGWILDPLVVAILWHVFRRSRFRWHLLGIFAIGYLGATTHYLIPDFSTTWPSLGYRIYFGVELAAGVVLLALCLFNVLVTRQPGQGLSARA